MAKIIHRYFGKYLFDQWSSLGKPIEIGFFEYTIVVTPKNNSDCIVDRLRPTRQKTKNAVANILANGEVCLEFIKTR